MSITDDDIRVELDAMHDERDARRELDAVATQIKDLQESYEHEPWDLYDYYETSYVADMYESAMNQLYDRKNELEQLI